MKFNLQILFLISSVYACGDNAYRCKHPNNSIDEDWEATREICEELHQDTCWCYHWAERYCDPTGDNIDKFKQHCQARGDNWYWTEC